MGLFIEATSKTWVIEPTNEAQTYVAPIESTPETPEEILSRVTKETNFDPQIVRNVIDTETGGTWDCTLKGEDGEEGCFQIIKEYHPEVDPLDFEASMRYFIAEYKAGRETAWVGCSCVASARLSVPMLPRGPAGGVIPNSTMERGKIAILDYNGIRHIVAYKLTPTGLLALSEGNYEPCLIRDRLIPWEEVNKHLVGFSDPDPASLALAKGEP